MGDSKKVACVRNLKYAQFYIMFNKHLLKVLKKWKVIFPPVIHDHSLSWSVPDSIIQKAGAALEVLRDVLDAVDTQHPEVC